MAELPAPPPQGLDEFLASSPSPQPVGASGPPPGLNQFIAPELKEAKYGTLPQIGLTALEGAGRGLGGAFSTGLETQILGVNPKDIQGREETNPATSYGSEATAFLTPALLTGGATAAARAGIELPEAVRGAAKLAEYSFPGLLTKAGKIAGEASGFGAEGAGLVSQIAKNTVQGGFEMGLMNGDSEAGKALMGDPTQTPGSVAVNVGLGVLFGGLFGGTLGTFLEKKLAKDAARASEPAFVSQLDKEAMDSGNFKTSIENNHLLSDSEKTGILEGLRQQKPNAPEIMEAAQRLGAPVPEGITSASPLVQKAEDSLINEVPTYSGIRRSKIYEEGYQKANDAISSALGEGSGLTKAQLGDSFQNSLSAKIEEQNAPIKKVYEDLRAGREVIPLGEDAIKPLVGELSQFQEFAQTPNSPAGRLLKRIMTDLPNAKTVKDLAFQRTSLNKSLNQQTATASEKYLAGVVTDKLEELENKTIENFAKTEALTPEAKAQVKGLIDQAKAAKEAYKPFITDVKTLAEQLGKKNIEGPATAVDFIRNGLTPEQVADRLFAKKDSQFLKFFQEKFPEEMELLRSYQKGALKEVASQTGEFKPSRLFSELGKLEPEIKESLFHPTDLQKLKDAELYLKNFPKNFNPSGTSGASAFREFFTHGLTGATGAAVANVRDLGIEHFIKIAGRNPDVAKAAFLGDQALKGYQKMMRLVAGVFKDDNFKTFSVVVPSVAATKALEKKIDDYIENPSKLLDMNQGNPVDSVSQGFSETAARAIPYLKSLKPSQDQPGIFNQKRVPSQLEVAAYERQLRIAEQPLMVLKHLNDGTLSPQDLKTVTTIYPGFFQGMQAQMLTQVLKQVEANKPLSYAKRMNMSLFLGKPLDATLTQSSILSSQMIAMGSHEQAQMNGSSTSGKSPLHSSQALEKIPSQYRTASQKRELSRS